MNWFELEGIAYHFISHIDRNKYDVTGSKNLYFA